MDIYNKDPKNQVSQEIYDAFNGFIFSPESKVISKFLMRYELFRKTMHLPGDILEMGVFKGSGMATWLKFLNFHSPGSNKKVIGFDLFEHDNKSEQLIEGYNQGKYLKEVISRVDKEELSLKVIEDKLKKIRDNFILIKGDVKETTKKFVTENPGMRISLLYLDLDLDEPTYESLCNLWDRVVPGGIIVFDEYEYHKFDESNGVDRFLREKNIKYNIQTTGVTAPSAYMIKE